MEQLFVYGTLKDPRIQEKVIGRTIKGSHDILEGYKISKINIKGKLYPIIVPQITSSIPGLIISVTDNELRSIDKYETNIYTRKKILLKSGRTAWVYQK